MQDNLKLAPIAGPIQLQLGVNRSIARALVPHNYPGDIIFTRYIVRGKRHNAWVAGENMWFFFLVLTTGDSIFSVLRLPDVRAWIGVHSFRA